MIQVEKIFSDHMILQRNCENRIYGKDFAHEKIGLLFRNQLYETVADGEGKWEPVKAIHRPGIVEIKIPERMQPKNYIRYAWYDNPGPLNFYNSAGLPAESFLIEFE